MSVEAVISYLKEMEVEDSFLNSVLFTIKKHNLKPINSHYELAIAIQKELNVIINNYDSVEQEAVNRFLLKIAGLIVLHFSVIEDTKMTVGLFSNNIREKGLSIYLTVARIQAFINHVFEASIKRNDVCREYSLIFDLCLSANL